MQVRTTTKTDAERAAPPPVPQSGPTAVRRSLGERVRSRLRGNHEEDGVFRPVRLPLWIDWGISALIVLVAAGVFVGFFTWLARTQGR